MKKTRIKPVGKKGEANRSALKKVTPALKEVSQGHCMNCGKMPDFRGLQRHELKYRSQGGKIDETNTVLWCASCHAGEKGHRTEGVKVSGYRDRTNDFMFGRKK